MFFLLVFFVQIGANGLCMKRSVEKALGSGEFTGRNCEEARYD